MSGPIVRSGPSQQYTDNWESVFGSKKPAASKPKAAKKTTTKAAKKTTAKKSAKKK